MPEGFYTIEEAANRLGVSQDELLRRVTTHGIRRYQDEGRLVFKSDEIDRLSSGAKRSTPGDSIFQSSSSGLFDVDDLMAELGTTSSSKSQGVSQPSGGLRDEPTELSPRAGSAANPVIPPAAAMPPTGLADELTDELTEVSRRGAQSSANMGVGGPAPSLTNASGSFGLQDEETESTPRPSRSTAPAGSSSLSAVDVPATGLSGIGPATTSRSGSMPAHDSGAVMSDSGLFNVQELVEQADIIRGSSMIPDDSTVIENAKRSNRSAGAVMSDSGLFDVQQQSSPQTPPLKSSAVTAASLSIEQAEPAESDQGVSDINIAPLGASSDDTRPLSGRGAVMSDSGLFDVSRNAAQMAPADEAGVTEPADETTGDSLGDSTVRAMPVSRPARPRYERGDISSGSGLPGISESDMQAANAGQGYANQGYSGQGYADQNYQAADSPSTSSEGLADEATRMSEPRDPMSSGFTSRSGSVSGAVMSDSGLFDVRDLVAPTGASGEMAAEPAVDAPTRVNPAGAESAAASYNRPARFAAKGSGQSDSGLFSAEEVRKLANDAISQQQQAQLQSPAGSPGASKGGLTIFDPEDFNVPTTDPSSQTMGLAANLDTADPRKGSGLGLRSPKAADEATSLGEDFFGSAEPETAPTAAGGATRPRSLTNSAIFGAQRASPSNQTEIMDAQQPFRPTATSGIFGSQPRASPTNATEIMDVPAFEPPPTQPMTPRVPQPRYGGPPTAAPTLSSSIAGASIGPSESTTGAGAAGFVSGDDLFNADDFNTPPQQQIPEARPGSSVENFGGFGMGSGVLPPSASGQMPQARVTGSSFSNTSNPSMTMPTGTLPMQEAEQADAMEPAFMVMLLVSTALLVLGIVMQALTLSGQTALFTKTYSESTLFVIIGTVVVTLLSLVGAFVLGRK